MGALYFMNPDYSDPGNVKWFHGSLTYLFTDEVSSSLDKYS